MLVQTKLIEQFIGDGRTYEIPLVVDGVPFAGGAHNLLWTVKEFEDDLDPAAKIQKSTGAGISTREEADGTFTAIVAIVAIDTEALSPKKYFWDIQLQVPGQSPYTVRKGIFSLVRDITRGLVSSIPIFTTEAPYPTGTPEEIAALSTATALEASRAQSVEGSLATFISIETSSRIAGDASLSSIDAALSSAITSEQSRALSAEGGLGADIDGEVERAVSVDASLSSAITTEASTRSTADASLATALSSANSTRSTADISLAGAITAEVSARASLASSIATSVTTGAVTCSGSGSFGSQTVKGVLSVKPGSGSAAIVVESATAADYAKIVIRENGVSRWSIGKNPAGDLTIEASDATGVPIGNALWFNNATRLATFDASIYVAKSIGVGTSLTVAGTNVLTALAGKVNSSATCTVYTATATLDFGSIAAGATATLTVSVTGAAVGDSVSLGLPSSPASGVVFNAYVSAANTVTVRATNCTASAIDPASASYRATVIHF